MQDHTGVLAWAMQGRSVSVTSTTRLAGSFAPIRLFFGDSSRNLFVTGESQSLCFATLPATTSKKSFWILVVTGPRVPAPSPAVELADGRASARAVKTLHRDIDVVARKAPGDHS